MAINPMDISLGGLATGSGRGVDEAKKSLNETYDQFLTLLTTQLKNQDPLNPMESKEFTNQLIQFAGVEQQIAQNEKLEQILAHNQALNINGAVSYIGKTINYEGQDFYYDGTPQNMSYFLEESANLTKITIMDENGSIVWSQDGERSAGEHALTWDGLSNDGLPLEEGRYTLQVGAEDIEGKAVKTGTLVPGRITGVEVIDGSIMLRIQDMLVSLDSVVSVTS